MYKAFQFFDTDSSGYITRDELMEGLKVNHLWTAAPFQLLSHMLCSQILQTII